MDFSKLRLGELVAGACGALLFIDMFLSWYGISGVSVSTPIGNFSNSGTSVTYNAWDIFSYTQLLLLLLVIVAVGAAVLTMTQRSVALPVAASVIVTALGAFVAIIVLYRIINQPGPNSVIDVKFGAYLGFLLCAGVTLGGFMSMRDEGTSFGEAAQQVQGGSRAAAPPPPAAPPPAAPPAAPAPPADPTRPGDGPPPSAPPPGV
jgi:hypothetical protein